MSVPAERKEDWEAKLIWPSSYIPGHIHAFYLLFVYFQRREQGTGGSLQERAPGIYSDTIQRGGQTEYGTVDT